MWTLGRFLPLVIGHLVPEDDEHWENVLCLLDIVFACLVGAAAWGELEALISDHDSPSIQFYPHASITMKMHSGSHAKTFVGVRLYV